MIAAVAAVDEVDFRCAPGLNSEAAKSQCTFGGDGIALATHGEPLPKRCKERGNTDGDEGNEEGCETEPEPKGKLGGGPPVEFCRASAKPKGSHECAEDCPSDGTPWDGKEHGADGGFAESSRNRLPCPKKLLVEIELLLEPFG